MNKEKLLELQFSSCVIEKKKIVNRDMLDSELFSTESFWK